MKMTQGQQLVQVLGLLIILFAVIFALLYYLIATDNIFKKLYYSIKVKTHVYSMIKELDKCSQK